MGNITIYVPDDLEREVRASGMNMSGAAQAGMRDELLRIASRRLVLSRCFTTFDEAAVPIEAP